MATRRRRHSHKLSAHQRRSRAARKAARTRARRYGKSSRRRAVAGDFGMNPRRRIRYRRNPRHGGGGSFGSVSGTKRLAIGAGIGAIGAVGLDYLWQWGSGYLPASLQTGYVGTAAKAAAALGAGWLASKAVGRPTAIAATAGALTVIGYQLLHQMISSAAPAAAIPATTTAATPALSAYQPGTVRNLGWTSPGSTLRGFRGLNAYMPGQMAAPMMGRPGGSVSPSGLASAGGWG